jgi:protein SCO1
MQKNKTYIWVSFIVLIFGIYAIPKIIHRIKTGTVVQNDGIGKPSNPNDTDSGLYKVGKVPAFSLTNQKNTTINNNSYLGKVFVVEFFFSTCPTICPIMNKNMVTIQDEFGTNPNFGIASISINPKIDTPEVLKKHSEFLKITSPNWNLLTGDQDYIMQLSTNGFNLYAGLNSKIPGGFEHSGLFALVDKKGYIRCRKDEFGNPTIYYDGIEQKGIKNIKQDIALLLKEN